MLLLSDAQPTGCRCCTPQTAPASGSQHLRRHSCSSCYHRLQTRLRLVGHQLPWGCSSTTARAHRQYSTEQSVSRCHGCHVLSHVTLQSDSMCLNDLEGYKTAPVRLSLARCPTQTAAPRQLLGPGSAGQVGSVSTDCVQPKPQT